MRPFAQSAWKFDTPLPFAAASYFLLAIASALDPLPGIAQSPGDTSLRQQIAKYSTIAAKADPPAMAPVDAGRIWTYLGTLYEDGGQYVQSEMAYMHALRLFERTPVSEADRARAMDDLGTLYMMRGDVEKAERAENHALQIRRTEGLTSDLPRSWYHLATLSLRKHRAKQAQEYAQEAVHALQAEPHPDPDDLINAQFVLAVADCRMNRYPEGISIMQNAMTVVRSIYGPDDFPTGFGSFLLGYAYWKAGDSAKADNLMKEGETTVEKQLGSSHPVTVTIQTQYEHYLRNTHQQEAARAIGRQLKENRSPGVFNQPSETLAAASLF